MEEHPEVSSLALLNMNCSSSDVIDRITQKIKGLSKGQKDRILRDNLQLQKYEGKRLKDVDISRIDPSLSFKSPSAENDGEDNNSVKVPEPLHVAAVDGVDELFLLDDFNLYESYKKKGSKMLGVEIMGQASCLSQLYVARALCMISPQKPVSNLDLSMGLVGLRKGLIKEFGKQAFCGHGGNRKGANKPKLNMSPHISKFLYMKVWGVRALLNFGSQLGPHALMGLQGYRETRELSVRSIHQLNGPIKKANLKGKIDDRLKQVPVTIHHKQEMMKEAGRVAYEFIQSKKDKQMTVEEVNHAIQSLIYDLAMGEGEPETPKDETPDAGGGGDVKGSESGDAKGSDSNSGQNENDAGPPPPKYRSVNAKELAEIKEKFKVFRKAIQKIETFLKTKRKLTKKETEGLSEMLQSISPAFTGFSISFTKTSTGK